MKGIVLSLIAFAVLTGLVISGCGSAKEASGRDAIDKSQVMTTIQQKTDYLVGQARAFVNSKQFDQAVSVAQYILSNVDSNSQEARSLLEKAKSQLTAQAKSAMENAKKQFGGFGK